jgi:hypothetical protein
MVDTFLAGAALLGLWAGLAIELRRLPGAWGQWALSAGKNMLVTAFFIWAIGFVAYVAGAGR